MMNNPVYIFLHIHKTAGVTLRSMVMRHYKKRNVYETYVPHLTKPTTQALVAKAFYGHNTWYGMHEVVGRDAYYITFLRQAYDRLVSLWYQHWLMWNAAKKPELQFDDFFEFLKSTTMVNSITQGPITQPRTLENAKRILSRFRFIGLQETFEADAKQLLPDQQIVTINVNSIKAKESGVILPPISEKQRQRLLEISKDDQELYEYAVQLRNGGHNNGFTL